MVEETYADRPKPVADDNGQHGADAADDGAFDQQHADNLTAADPDRFERRKFPVAGPDLNQHRIRHADIAAPQPGARAFEAKIYRRAGQRDLAAVRGVDCGDTIKQGRLTRSAWPHDRHQFTGAYLQRQVLKYGDLLRAQLLGLDEAGNFERGRR